MSNNDLPNLFGRDLDPRLERHFAPLCIELDNLAAMELRQEIINHVEDFHKALKYNEFLDIDTAIRIAKVLINLLDNYDSYPKSHQKLIVGAARYFVSPHDADPDTTSLLGLDDDAAVLNYVLDTIGKPELKIEL